MKNYRTKWLKFLSCLIIHKKAYKRDSMTLFVELSMQYAQHILLKL